MTKYVEFMRVSGCEILKLNYGSHFEIFLHLAFVLAYRNWMNSLGVNPFVYHLYNDLNNGLILFQVFIILIFLRYTFL